MTIKAIWTSIFLISCIFISLSSCSEDEKYAKSAIFVNINDYTHKYAPKSEANVPVDLTATGEDGWEGTVSVQLKKGDSILIEESQEAEVAKEAKSSLSISIQLPEEEGTYELVAIVRGHQDQAVKSRRLIEIEKPIDLQLP